MENTGIVFKNFTKADIELVKKNGSVKGYKLVKYKNDKYVVAYEVRKYEDKYDYYFILKRKVIISESLHIPLLDSTYFDTGIMYAINALRLCKWEVDEVESLKNINKE